MKIHHLIQNQKLCRTTLCALAVCSSINVAHATPEQDCENLTSYPIYNGKITEAEYITAGKSEKDPFRMFTGAPDLDFDQAESLVKETGALNDATSTMLNTFVQNGSKLMIIQGGSDPVFSADDIENWYLKTKQTTSNGDQSAMNEWNRLFMVPGMTHCGGGPALDDLDPLTAMQNWVEKQQSPGYLPAKGKSFPGKNMPICAYPQVATYKGKGDINAIESYQCI